MGEARDGVGGLAAEEVMSRSPRSRDPGPAPRQHRRALFSRKAQGQVRRCLVASAFLLELNCPHKLSLVLGARGAGD